MEQKKLNKETGKQKQKNKKTKNEKEENNFIDCLLSVIYYNFGLR